jgi:hypothetical protein
MIETNALLRLIRRRPRNSGAGAPTPRARVSRRLGYACLMTLLCLLSTLECFNARASTGDAAFTAGSYVITPSADDQTAVVQIAGIINTTANTTSGSLGFELWYSSAPYNGGTIEGYEVAASYLPIGNCTSSQLAPGASCTGITVTDTLTVPPAGTYYPVLVLVEFESSCTTNNGYCIDDYVNLLNVVTGGPTVTVSPVNDGGSGSTGNAEVSGPIQVSPIDWTSDTVDITAASVTNISNVTSGSLALQLWFTDTPYTGGVINSGYKVASFPLPASCTTGNAQLAAGMSCTSIDSGTISVTAPPAGTYYAALVLVEYNPSLCPSNAGYCIDNGLALENQETVPDPTVITTTTTTTTATGGGGGGGGGSFSLLDCFGLALLLVLLSLAKGRPDTMLLHKRSLGRAARVVGLCALGVTISAMSATTSGWEARVSTNLLKVYRVAAARTADSIDTGTTKPSQPSVMTGARFDAAGRVQVDAVFDCAQSQPTDTVKAAGLQINAAVHTAPICVIEGWVAPSSIPKVASVTGINQVQLPVYALRRHPKVAQPQPASSQLFSPSLRFAGRTHAAGTTPTIDGNGITITRADQFIAQTKTNGSGVTVGVMSGDATNLALIQSRSELPKVTVVGPSPGVTPTQSTDPTDEGTMMLEEVHAVAPGANLAFCGPSTAVEYVGCLGTLTSAGATILVDDLAFPGFDLMSSNGAFPKAVQGAVAANVALFTVTENFNGSYWEGNYAPVALSTLGPGGLLTCNGQSDYYAASFGGALGEELTVLASGTYPVFIQWADPFGANVSNFDVYVISMSGTIIACQNAAGSSDTYITFDTPIAQGNYIFVVATPNSSLAGKFIKFFVGGDGDTTLSTTTTGSIISPQAFVPGVITVGAVNGADGIGGTIEPYSGQGPINLLFPSPIQIQAPSFVAPDAVYVDAAGTDFTPDSNGLFDGTSAAAPNAAAVAALLRGAFPNMTPTQLTSALQSGAVQLASTVPSGTFGYGRVDALGALAVNPAPTLSAWPNTSVAGGGSTTSSPLTVAGFGNLTLTVTSSNAALIPASLVAAGAAGVTISPATCGAGTTACTIVATPVIGQVGTATVTVTATDGASRQGQTAAVITVTKPAAPTITASSGSSQSITVGGTLSPINFALTGTGTLTVSAVSSNGTVLPQSGVSISSGCGSTSVNCSASLSPAPGQTGSSTVTLTVRDPYSQTSVATATLQVNAVAPTHGGGALGSWFVLSLVGLAVGKIFAYRRRW